MYFAQRHVANIFRRVQHQPATAFSLMLLGCVFFLAGMLVVSVVYHGRAAIGA